MCADASRSSSRSGSRIVRYVVQSRRDLQADHSRPTDAKKLNLDEIADRAGEKFDGDGDDRMNGSANGTSAVEIIVSCRAPFLLPAYIH